MKIYIVRHGEAVSPEIDPEKPLSPEGRAEIEKIAKFLAKNSFPLSLILHSDKARARQTAEIMGEHLAPGLKLEEHPNLAPNDPIQAAFVRVASEENDAMIVGHLPFLEKMLGHMVVHDENAHLIQFGPGTTVCLEANNGGWVIRWVVGQDQIT